MRGAFQKEIDGRRTLFSILLSVRTDFGSIDSGVEPTKCEPWKITDDLVGRMKGIQGHRNSCYLDATLYAMFVQSTAFDRLLERPANRDDIPQYRELQRFHYVRADHIMKVRELLAKSLTHMRGLTSEEKDPEEVLTALFGQLLRAQPLVELINLKDNKVDRTYLCPLIVDDWTAGVATTQHLLERSMRSANVKFAFPPKTLILQLPRYGQQKLFDKILPLERIEITGLVNNAVQACHGCGKPAEGMCPECFLCKRVTLSEVRIENHSFEKLCWNAVHFFLAKTASPSTFYYLTVSYCVPCATRVHYNAGEQDHAIRLFYPSGRPVKKPAVHRMVLSAVLCIETSHYVAFVRSLSGRWLFFDSMADREGLSDGFNVPQVKDCERMSWWLSQAGWEKLRDADEAGTMKAMLGKGSDVDPLVTRLLSDSYICFYHDEPSSHGSNSSSNLLNNMIQKVVKPLT
ncbi:unnamed protein product [Heligmosomoides polygyrus]|uniref:USP domain-containing protein n=1 Tax=Heligmosomoides polygyrus TaxID=6339 RepID=A0A183GFQ2_HELPZ|nr:unnamed protein product [Heligmosomoides polygyrus]